MRGVNQSYYLRETERERERERERFASRIVLLKAAALPRTFAS